MTFTKCEHRTVVLPTFQGLGFGSRMCDGIAELLSFEGRRLQSKTAHPKYGSYRDRSILWKPTGVNHMVARDSSIKDKIAPKKKYYSHVYVQRYERMPEHNREEKCIAMWEALKDRVRIVGRDHSYEYKEDEEEDRIDN